MTDAKKPDKHTVFSAREMCLDRLPHGAVWVVFCHYRAMMLQGAHGTGCTSSLSSSSALSSCSILFWVCCQGKERLSERVLVCRLCSQVLGTFGTFSCWYSTFFDTQFVLSVFRLFKPIFSEQDGHLHS